jgi:segregation and condensation protein A
MTYKVQLPVFEGPLDLLLYLIKKDEINIHDIPIAGIADQYLEYLEMMKLLDLDIAGEFILMAATLMHIKSRTLLPIDEKEEVPPKELDPREELVKKLLEYKKFKEAAGRLKEMNIKRRDIFTRQGKVEMADFKDEEEASFEASLFDLITAFSKVLKEVPKAVFHEVIRDEFTVSDKIHDILHILVDKKTIHFGELFKNAKNKGEIVAIFLALLELIKLREIIVKQLSPFSEIEIMRNPAWQRR